MHSRRTLLILAVVVLMAGSLLWLFRRPRQVDVCRPVKREVVELVVATGYFRPARHSSLAADIQGIVEHVPVSEGDVVQAGDVVAVLRRQTLDDRVAQLQSVVERSEAELARASRPAYPDELALARAELRRAAEVNRALVDAERERLRKLEAGGRAEERRAAEAQEATARAERENAEAGLRRGEQLFAAGAIAQAELDNRVARAAQARAAEAAAREAVALAAAPAREEDIVAARATVRAAEATLRTAVDAAQQRLNALLQQPRSEDVFVARARVNEAKLALREALSVSEKTVVKAPFNGVVTARFVEPGQGVTPSQSLVAIADTDAGEIRVETDEANLRKLRIGQSARVFAPAYRGSPFDAVLTRIGPAIDRRRGVVELRLSPRRTPPYLRADMTLDVNLVVAQLPGALALPLSAVLREGETSYVLAAERNRVVRRAVTVRASSTQWAAVAGLSERALVLVQGDSARAGERVRPREVPADVR